MLQGLHSDDAFAFIVDKLRTNPDGYCVAGNASFDVWLPNLVWQYLPTIGYSLNQQGEFQQDSQLEAIWRAFYDAAWRLCHIGVLLTSVSWSRYTGGRSVRNR
jgi:hypothetical protein